ncbi:hypothetical protein GCM10027169_25350 [Gordonia jinhuaensis]|uniref:Uncharacterized protein n=1 Tax=Gordonia jinhuaensis TaxID=1517702 RepID=A0A916WY28_9ACTN|nr:hypothetical protein [Gordonia jinhuaensis]GGB39473.1 hypothetical protein GCM10011489_28950 [Gordonia jinhuaensis]
MISLRNSLGRKTIRSTAAGIVAVGAAAGMVVAGTGSASAATIAFPFTAHTTTTVAKLGLNVDFGNSPLNTELDLGNPAGTDEHGNTIYPISGTLALKQASAKLQLGPINLASMKISVVDAGPVTGTGTVGASIKINAKQSFKVKIDSVAPLGLDAAPGSSSVNLVGKNCETTKTEATLSGGALGTEYVDQATGKLGQLDGSYDIPAFHNCGALTPLLTAIVSGPNNKLSVTLSKASTADAQSQMAALKAKLR